MIQLRTLVNVADNSGAKRAQCIKVLGGHHKRYGRLGDIVVVSIRDAIPGAAVKKGDVAKAVVVRAVKDENARALRLLAGSVSQPAAGRAFADTFWATAAIIVLFVPLVLLLGKPGAGQKVTADAH